MKKSEYQEANKKIEKLSKIKNKTPEQVKEAIQLIQKVQKYKEKIYQNDR